MQLKIAKAVGLNTDQEASLVASSSLEENPLLAVLSLSCDDAFTVGRQILADLQDLYFEEEGTPAEKLKKTFLAAEEKLSSFESSIILASISGKVLYLIGKGKVRAYLQRFEKLSPILSEQDGQLISGFLQEGDRVFLSTENLVNFLGEKFQSLLELPLAQWEEEIGARVTQEESTNLAGLLLSVDEDEVAIPAVTQEAVEEVVSKPPPEILEKIASVVPRVKNLFPHGGRVRFILALILILIVISGVGFKYKQSRDKERDVLFRTSFEEAKKSYDAALGLQNLNPAEAMAKLSEASDHLNKALSLKSKDREAQELKKKIDEGSGSITGQFKGNISLFLDLDLIKKDFRSKNLSLSVGKIATLDPNAKTLVVIDTAKKSHQILAGKDALGEAVSSSINGDLVFVYSKDKGVLRIDISNQKITNVSSVDKDWGEIVDLIGFAGNVYLLDSKSNQIWKYIPTQSGYSDKREYLTKETKARFDGSIKMQIESSIYVLKQGGEIMRFTRGISDFFSIGGLDKGIKESKSFFISSDTENLYILDSGNSRLLVLTKAGGYKSQYQGEEFGRVTDLVVDEKEKKVYLLEGNKIWMMDLK